MLHRISRVVPLSDSTLQLTYSNDGIVIVDFKPLIRRGGIFTSLGNSEFFSQVEIGEGGRYIQWPGELDFCADALWLQQHVKDDTAA